MADSANEQVWSSGQGLTPASAYSAGQHASGYHTPDLATRSSSPGSGSFHTANPIDSERSSLTDHGEDLERDELSSVEIPSLGEMPTLLASSQGQGRGRVDDTQQMEEEEEEETEVTLQSSPSSSPGLSDGQRGREARGERNWINQPKLEPAESEAVPPCPRKRPLHEGIESREPPHTRVTEPSRETTPLLSSSNRQSNRHECCVVL